MNNNKDQMSIFDFLNADDCAGLVGSSGRTKGDFEDYEGFVDKFKPKLTTDDCYTPEIVYNAIGEWITIPQEIEMTSWDKRCSVCNAKAQIEHNFCPNCGADMRKDVNDDER